MITHEVDLTIEDSDGDLANPDATPTVDGSSGVSSYSIMHSGLGIYNVRLEIPDETTTGFIKFNWTIGATPDTKYIRFEVEDEVSVAADYDDLQNMIVSVFQQDQNLPNITEFSFIEDNDYDQANLRGGIGPFTINTPLDITTLPVRCGFTKKIGALYQGIKFDTTVDIVATGVPDEYEAYINIPGATTLGKPIGDYGFDIKTDADLGGGNIDEISLYRGDCTLQSKYGATVT